MTQRINISLPKNMAKFLAEECKRNMSQMNPVMRFGAKVSERNGDCLKTWQRHFESKTQRQTGARTPKIEQGLSTALKNSASKRMLSYFRKWGIRGSG